MPDQSMDVIDSDFLGGDLEFDFGSIDYSTITTTEESAQPRGLASNQQRGPQRQEPDNDKRKSLDPNLDSQGVLACCHIIIGMESYLDAKVQVLDLTLTVVKKAVEDLAQSLRSPTSMESATKPYDVWHNYVPDCGTP
jgi:hypothetical protein